MASIQSSKSESTGSPAAASTTQAPTSPGNSATTGDDAYPEQRHAGEVGYGPNYHAGPSLEDKMEGLKEEIKGKLTRNPDKVQHGKEVYTGEQKRKELTGEDEPNPFATAKEDDSEDPNKIKDKSANENTNEKEGESVQLPSSSTANTNQPSETPTQNSTQSQSHSETNVNAKATPAGIAVDQGHGPGAKEQAATVAPEGTHDANVQKKGGAVDNVKQIDTQN